MSEVVQLLQQIADNTSRDDSVWIAAVSGGAAVLAAAAVAATSYLVARIGAESLQKIETARLRATVVTTERLRWLQDIRQRLSRFYAQVDMQYSHLKRPVQLGQTAEGQKALDAFSSQIMEECNIITLMLNPEKPEQAALRKALQDALQFLRECFSQKGSGAATFDDMRYASLKQTAFDSLTSVGIQTWNRIQKLG